MAAQLKAQLGAQLEAQLEAQSRSAAADKAAAVEEARREAAAALKGAALAAQAQRATEKQALEAELARVRQAALRAESDATAAARAELEASTAAAADARAENAALRAKMQSVFAEASEVVQREREAARAAVEEAIAAERARAEAQTQQALKAASGQSSAFQKASADIVSSLEGEKKRLADELARLQEQASQARTAEDKQRDELAALQEALQEEKAQRQLERVKAAADLGEAQSKAARLLQDQQGAAERSLQAAVEQARAETHAETHSKLGAQHASRQEAAQAETRAAREAAERTRREADEAKQALAAAEAQAAARDAELLELRQALHQRTEALRKAAERIQRMVGGHPNILPLLGGPFLDDSEVHLVLPFCSGGELYEAISSGAADSFITEPCAVALVKMMTVGTPDDPHRETMDEMCGTFNYMAPEVFGKCYTRCADLWSLGVIAHILLLGRPPYKPRVRHAFERDPAKRRQAVPLPIVWAEEDWADRSPMAQAFVAGLLCEDPFTRTTADAAQRHPWLLQEEEEEEEEDSLFAKFGDFQWYVAQEKLHTAAIRVASKLVTAAEVRQMKVMFVAMDVSQTGRLTENDILAATQAAGVGTVGLGGAIGDLGKADDAAGDGAKAAARKLFRAMDVKERGEVQYYDFQAFVLRKNMLGVGHSIWQIAAELCAQEDGGAAVGGGANEAAGAAGAAGAAETAAGGTLGPSTAASSPCDGCENFDMCEECLRDGEHRHDAAHSFSRVPVNPERIRRRQSDLIAMLKEHADTR
eukprot:g5821.t1